MTAELFHQAFDQIADPVLLKTEGQWQMNPAAKVLGLSEVDLTQLEDWGNDAFTWLALRFYHVSAQRLDGDLLLFLRQDTFLAEAAENVAAQLRQRLQSAFGCATDLSKMDGVRNDLRARERLSGINQDLYQLLRMTQELELSSRTDPILCHPRCFDLVTQFTQLFDEVGALLKGSKVELKLDVEPEALVLTADWKRLKFLMLSLISNALPHLPQHGGKLTLGLREQKGQAILSVADNGDGFSPTVLAHPLWNEPHRLLVGRGLGLGLPLVQRIAAAHEGRVMVFPSSKGSRVTVSLPIRVTEDQLSTPQLPGREESGFSMAKILLSNALPRSVYYPTPEED